MLGEGLAGVLLALNGQNNHARLRGQPIKRVQYGRTLFGACSRRAADARRIHIRKLNDLRFGIGLQALEVLRTRVCPKALFKLANCYNVKSHETDYRLARSD